MLANSGARAGDRLILTKALGTGVISTAIKRGTAQQSWIDAATDSMTRLNRAAAEVITRPEFQAHGMTDITGFGLIGHGREMALGSDVSLRIQASDIPLLAGALECVRAGYIPGGLKANREFAECNVQFGANVTDELRTLLFDPQTAGGLLISLAANQASAAAASARSGFPSTAPVGRRPAGAGPV